MAKTIKFSGDVRVLESVGSVVELNRVFEYSNELSEAIWNYYDIPDSSVDVPISFGGVSPAKVIYIKPNGTVQVKMEDTSSTEFTLNAGVTVIYGSPTAMFVTTGTEDVKLDVIVFG